jgi:transposase
MPKKFSKEQRLAIGQQIYNDEITVNEAASRYDISPYTARDYMRFFETPIIWLPRAADPGFVKNRLQKKASSFETTMLTLTWSREELLEEICRLRINEERLKKGYQVKEVNGKKLFIRLGKPNTK